MSSVPLWLHGIDSIAGGTTAGSSSAVAEPFAEPGHDNLSPYHSHLDNNHPDVHQILQSKLSQLYAHTAAGASQQSPLAALGPPWGEAAGTGSAFAATSPLSPWPTAPWDAPAQSGVPDSLEAAYGNYLDQPAYAQDDDGVDYSSGLPTPELTDGYHSAGTFHSSLEPSWSPQSLVSPPLEPGPLVTSYDSSFTTGCSPTDMDAYATHDSYSHEAAAINPALCSPEAVPNSIGLHVPYIPQAVPNSIIPAPFEAFKTLPESYMPSPVSRRSSLAPPSAPLVLAPLPPLPPLPSISSSRLEQLTTSALASRAAKGIEPPTRSAASSCSGSRSREASQHARSPSAGEGDADSSNDERPRQAAVRSRASRSTGRRTPQAAKGRPVPAGVAGFAATCRACGVRVATLHFRGKADALAVKVRGEYVCVGCAPVSPSLNEEGHRRQSSVSEEEAACAGYEATLSALLDRLQNDGRPPSPPATAYPPRERLPTSALGLSGMNKPAAAGTDVLCCDVCKHALARGALVPVDSRQAVAFGVEVVCVSCKDKFARCSDCGGGGGPRLGVGKWRSLELFPGGRKTCTLSHLRLGALGEMSYDVHRVRDLPQHELATLMELCSELHYTSVVTSLATPDALEGEFPAARTFEEVKRLGVDGWALYEHMLKEDVEASEGKRRYVGLRWSTPVPRKKAKPPKSSGAKPGAATTAKPVDDPLPAGTILRPGKKLVGVVIAEHDLAHGSCFLPLTMPLGHVGEQYDGQTALYVALHARLAADVAALNATRSIRDQLPPLREAWTLAMVRRDARGVNYLEKRRGYAPLEGYAGRLGERGREAAGRLVGEAEGFMPAELLKGWAIFAREVVEGDEWAARTAGVGAGGAGGGGAQAGGGRHKRKASLGSEAGMAKKGKKKA